MPKQVLSGSPPKDDDGIYQVEITVSDSAGFTDTKTIELTATSFQYTSLGSATTPSATLKVTMLRLVAAMTAFVRGR